MFPFWALVLFLIVVAVAVVAIVTANRSARSDDSPPIEQIDHTSDGSGSPTPPGRPLFGLDVEMGELLEMPSVVAASLPDRYGDDRLSLLIRDPYWLFAYWELTPHRELRTESLIGAHEYAHAKRVLRLCDLDTNERWDTECSLANGSWYLNPARPGHEFVAELGLIVRPDRYVVLLRSNVVRAPTDRPSELWDPEWALPEELWHRLHPWGYRQLVGGASPGWESLRQVPMGRSPGQGTTPWDRSG